ncbi:MAG TPA: type II toxin-antitoxin system VapC family toxin [Planctomycetota bacterium]|nr:type II toxin-antitoxin system VapC family toxin [Planctomycetota bacterium]
MTLVVDASVASKWFFTEPDSAAARRLLERHTALIAPDLLFAEVGNIGWKKCRQGASTPAQLAEVAVVLPVAFAQVVSVATVLPRALAIALELEHPVYDAIYLAVAELHDVRLVTADDRLVTRLRGTRWSRRATLLK